MNLKFTSPLNLSFQPAVLINRNYVAAARITGKAVPLVIGLKCECLLVSCYETYVFPDADAATLQYVERTVKFLLFARGGWKNYVGGQQAICEFIRKTYSPRFALLHRSVLRHFCSDLVSEKYPQLKLFL